MARFRNIEDDGDWKAGNTYTFEAEGFVNDVSLLLGDADPMPPDASFGVRWYKVENNGDFNQLFYDRNKREVDYFTITNTESAGGNWYKYTVSVASDAPIGEYYFGYTSVNSEGFYTEYGNA